MIENRQLGIKVMPPMNENTRADESDPERFCALSSSACRWQAGQVNSLHESCRCSGISRAATARRRSVAERKRRTEGPQHSACWAFLLGAAGTSVLERDLDRHQARLLLAGRPNATRTQPNTNADARNANPKSHANARMHGAAHVA